MGNIRTVRKAAAALAEVLTEKGVACDVSVVEGWHDHDPRAISVFINCANFEGIWKGPNGWQVDLECDMLRFSYTFPMPDGVGWELYSSGHAYCYLDSYEKGDPNPRPAEQPKTPAWLLAELREEFGL